MARSALLVCAAALLLVAAGAQDVGSTITQSMFESMLKNRNDNDCPARGFYTYDAFITAAKSFPKFGTTGSAELRKRELAAFFGQTSHETNGAGMDNPFQKGYCFKEEQDSPYKTKSAPYYGRGPIQLTGRSNYEMAGKAVNHPELVDKPDLAVTDRVVSFQTAIWFWMTAQGNKPSCHDVILGSWTPSDADRAAGRVPGYGVITNIINGGIDCGKGANAANVDRIGYYKRYCDMLGTTTGSNLDCYTQKNFTA